MRPEQLKSGDAILVDGTSWISDAIEDFTDCPWTHVAMFVDGVVYEMDWPKCKATPLDQWLEKYKGYVMGVIPLRVALWPNEENAIETWWLSRIGLGYDWPLLIMGMPIHTTWQKIVLALKLPPSWAKLQPPANNGVCSTNVAWAWQAAGLPVDETTGMTPADCAKQTFVCPVELLER